MPIRRTVKLPGPIATASAADGSQCYGAPVRVPGESMNDRFDSWADAVYAVTDALPGYDVGPVSQTIGDGFHIYLINGIVNWELALFEKHCRSAYGIAWAIPSSRDDRSKQTYTITT